MYMMKKINITDPSMLSRKIERRIERKREMYEKFRVRERKALSNQNKEFFSTIFSIARESDDKSR